MMKTDKVCRFPSVRLLAQSHFSMYKITHTIYV